MRAPSLARPGVRAAPVQAGHGPAGTQASGPDLIFNATVADGSGTGVTAQTDVLAINGLPELLRASPECAALLSRLVAIADPAQSLILAGDWIGSRPVPGGPQLEKASRLHCGPLGELTDFAPKKRSNWLELAPRDGEAIYHRRGWKPVKLGFSMPVPDS
jgi:hypothetical protein